MNVPTSTSPGRGHGRTLDQSAVSTFNMIQHWCFSSAKNPDFERTFSQHKCLAKLGVCRPWEQQKLLWSATLQLQRSRSGRNSVWDSDHKGHTVIGLQAEKCSQETLPLWKALGIWGNSTERPAMPKQIGDHFSQRLAEVPKQKVDFRRSLRGGCETIQSQSPPNKLEDLPKQYQTTSPCKVHLGDPVRVRSYAKSIKKYFVLFQCIKRIWVLVGVSNSDNQRAWSVEQNQI